MQSATTDLSVNSSDMMDVDAVLHQAVTAGDPLIIADYGNKLIATVRLKGVALAKLFFGMKSNWPLFQAAGIEEEFVDFVDAHMQFDSRTADKYADMYKEVLENHVIPAETREQLKRKPIQTLLLLTSAVREGDLDTDDLEKVVVLDLNAVQRMVREARGDATNSKTAVYGRLVTDKGRRFPPGAIVAYGKDKNGELEVEAIGSLQLAPRTRSGEKLLARLVRKMNLEDKANGEN